MFEVIETDAAMEDLRESIAYLNYWSASSKNRTQLAVTWWQERDAQAARRPRLGVSRHRELRLHLWTAWLLISLNFVQVVKFCLGCQTSANAEGDVRWRALIRSSRRPV